MGLESQLWKAEDVNQQLLQRVRYLEAMLRKSSVAFAPMAAGFDLVEYDDDNDDSIDNGDSPRVANVDARIELRAALIVQRWWRAKLLRKRHAELLASFQTRRQTRQKTDPRPAPTGDGSRLTVGRSRDAGRTERAPSTSLGLRKSVSAYAGAGDARRHTSKNRRPLPVATSLNLTMLAKQSGQTKASNRLSVAATFAEIDEHMDDGSLGLKTDQSPEFTETADTSLDTAETLQLWQRQHLSDADLASTPGTPRTVMSPTGLERAVIPEESSVAHVRSATAAGQSASEQAAIVRKASTASFVLQTVRDLALQVLSRMKTHLVSTGD